MRSLKPLPNFIPTRSRRLTAAGMAGLVLAASVCLPLTTLAQRPGYHAAGQSDSILLSWHSRTLHVIVGQSLVIKTHSRLRKIYISNPSVLDSYTVNPHQLLVSVKSAGVSTLAVWNELGRYRLYTVISGLDVTGLQAALDAAFPHQQIHASAQLNRITLTGAVTTKEEAARAENIAAGYGKIITNSLLIHPPHLLEVQLKVRFAEVDRTRARELGFNFIEGQRTSAVVSTQQFPAFSNSTLGGSSATSSVAVSNPLNLLLYNSDLNLGAAIRALESDQVLQILAEPTITSLSGVTASFLSGGQFPFPVVQGGTGGLASVSVQFKPYGVRLTFTPYVNPDGTIRLKVAPEVSALDYSNSVQISGYTVPAVATRRATTEVELRNGQSFAISGLLDHRLTDDFRHMPQIAKIPVLGWLFKSKQLQTSTTDLIVIVTPTIVNPLKAPHAATALPKTVRPYMSDRVFDERINPRRESSKTRSHGKGKSRDE